MSEPSTPAHALPPDGHPRPGTLYLVPAPLDFGCETQVPVEDGLPAATLRAAAGLGHWVCENAKSARALLKRIDSVAPLTVPIQQMSIRELPREVHKKGDHGGGFDARDLLVDLQAGHDVGLLSEAGMPAVADPGSSVVRAAHDLGAPVVPLVGPVSLLLALSASGLGGQDFAFTGYLPQDAEARRQRIRDLEGLALKRGQTQIVIETPYRNEAVLQALVQTLQPNTRLAVASGLTLPQAQISSRSVKAWRALPERALGKLPAVFAFGR